MKAGGVGQKYSSTLSSTSAKVGVDCVSFNIWKRDPVPIVEQAGWASKPVWTDTEKIFPAGVRNRDNPARNDYAITAAINKGQNKTQKKTGRRRKYEREERTNE